MKTILLATDFSEVSHNAAEYSIQLARAFNGRLVLFNAWQVPVPMSEMPMIVSREEMEFAVGQSLETDRETLDARHTVNVIMCLKEGIAADKILEAATEAKADLIVSGMKKTGRGLRRMFGNTVTALARKSTIPLLIVPEEAKYVPANIIALANENDLAPFDTRLPLLIIPDLYRQ